MTKKKIENAVLEYHNFSFEMREKQAENQKKITDFLETIKPHNPKTYQATPESEIMSGWITKCGLEYHFEIQDGAYIKEDIRIIGNTKLADFIKLSN